jgi:flagellar basal body-associated protein FliL
MEPEKKSSGAFIGLVVIIVILIIGGIYIWLSSKNVAPSTQAVTSQDSSDLTALETDLQTANTSTGVDVNTVK